MSFFDKYKNKNVDLEKVVDEFFIDNGIAHIYCRVNNIYDVINRYSVEGYEIANPEFISYLKQLIQYVPDDLPLALEITGTNFSEKEKKSIEDALWNHFEMLLAKVVDSKKYSVIHVIWNVIFLISGALYFTISQNAVFSGLEEVFYILFWFAGDNILDYFFSSRYDINSQRVRYAQLQTMKIIFTDKFEDKDFTNQEVSKICEEVEENIKSTEI